MDTRDRAIYIGLAASLLGLVLYMSWTLDQSTQTIEALRMELEVRDLESQLRAPSEAIFFDPASLESIVQQRQALLRARDTDGMLPYRAVARLAEDGFTEDPIPVDDLSQLIVGSFENYWHNRAFATAELISLLLADEDGVGAFLRRNPQVFETRIAPHLRRMLQGYSIPTRLSAARALYTAGDRSEIVRATVVGLLTVPEQLTPGDRALLEDWQSNWPDGE